MHGKRVHAEKQFGIVKNLKYSYFIQIGLVNFSDCGFQSFIGGNG